MNMCQTYVALCLDYSVLYIGISKIGGSLCVCVLFLTPNNDSSFIQTMGKAVLYSISSKIMNDNKRRETKRVEEKANDLGPAQSYLSLLNRSLSISFLKIRNDSNSKTFSDSLLMSNCT